MSALLALSDVLVVRALERCCSRGLTGDARRATWGHGPRHRAYERIRIPTGRHTYALEDAWLLCPDLVYRWQLPIEAAEWAIVLDRYCRDLMTGMRPHTLDDLGSALALLGAGHAV